MGKFKESKLFFWSVELLVLFTLVLVASHTLFVFKPLQVMIQTLFAPFLISFFLFYLLKPLVEYIHKKLKWKRTTAVLIVFLLLILSVVVIVGTIIPGLISQITELIKNIPGFLQDLGKWLEENSTKFMINKEEIETFMASTDMSISSISKNILTSISTGALSFIGNIVNVLVVAFTVPMVLFYLLKDSGKMVQKVTKAMPLDHQEEVAGLIKKMNQTISSYISGQAIECLFVAIGTFIGYLIIGVDYALLFGFLAGATNIIPYIGPYIGLAPVIFVTAFDSPLTALLACVVVLVVQQVDSNLVYPNIMGKSLDVHPLTIFVILLVAGNLAGLLGMILGVPVYAVTKVIIMYILDIRQLNKQKQEFPTEMKEEKK
ncbi:AI-2E family transporter [Vagococcus sp. BWB3-3]|uniref:AI-2E family transporter n=1 Tax=Vagococcus allomyrinae TaxID=2794353 RepID=A0A940P3F4_9ENTE|nr:AI-2E family transporter [Vagococcus allomyrinae]MBP1040310.1 AI-2E family transporter [Vagococcus allomyrinae]